MSTVRFPAPRKLKVWRALDSLMSGRTPRQAGRQRPFTAALHLHFLFSVLSQGTPATPPCPRQPERPDDRLFDTHERRSDGSWWHTGFPHWSTF